MEDSLAGFPASNVLAEDPASFWMAGEEDRSVVLDLGCMMAVNEVNIINNKEGNKATKAFK